MLRAVVTRTLAVLLVAAAWSPRPVRADAVVGTGWAGSCTEAALDSALADGGKVTFNCGGAATITVTSTKTISPDTTIDGGGVITISGGHSVGVFFVNPGVKFTVQNLTIANGNSSGIHAGGGIYNNGGTLAVSNSTFSGNSGHHGGGIDNEGTLTVTNSTFSGNIGGGGRPSNGRGNAHEKQVEAHRVLGSGYCGSGRASLGGFRSYVHRDGGRVSCRRHSTGRCNRAVVWLVEEYRLLVC